jgi:hypothetical protein
MNNNKELLQSLIAVGIVGEALGAVITNNEEEGTTI